LLPFPLNVWNDNFDDAKFLAAVWPQPAGHLVIGVAIKAMVFVPDEAAPAAYKPQR
jgi:hypothetical protein